jgi:DNA-binding GntR family transcriptional regulator
MTDDTLTNRTYKHLQQQLLRGDLRAGSVLSESQLAKELGVSRTPVGEAIKQLVHEGLVEQIPRYGTIVREIEWNEIEELYELREALESYAAARAAERISPAQVTQLKLLCDSIEDIAHQLEQRNIMMLEGEMLQTFLAADIAFHLLIVRACGNQRILRTIRETRTVSQIFRIRRLHHNLAVVRRACEDHRRILSALQRRDAEAASRAIADHIRLSKLASREWVRDSKKEPELAASLYAALPQALVEELRRLEVDGER